MFASIRRRMNRALHEPKFARSADKWRGAEQLEGRHLVSTLLALTDNNFLMRFNSAAPGTIDSVQLVTGLQAGERMVGIDFRPRTGQLFGVGLQSGATDTVRLYTIN